MPKSLTQYHPLSDIPEVCDVCGQKIDRNSRAGIAHHNNPKRHLPYAGKRKRVGW